MQSIRGQSIGMVFQEPMTALNPVQTIGRQLTESLELHTDLTDQARIKKAIAMLDRVGIPAPDIRMAEYPHQLSGGMRQRVVIAMALICKPNLLIADEPTTSLDAAVAGQVMAELSGLCDELGSALLLMVPWAGIRLCPTTRSRRSRLSAMPAFLGQQTVCRLAPRYCVQHCR